MTRFFSKSTAMTELISKTKILSIYEICDWLKLFQNRVNQLTGSEYLKFTCDVWMPDAPPDLKPKNKKVKINRKSAFPYLDMELCWINDELKFRVHLKKGQLLKYLNKGSAHTNACLKAIPSGVLRRLASLTSLLPDNDNVCLLYTSPSPRDMRRSRMPSSA